MSGKDRRHQLLVLTRERPLRQELERIFADFDVEFGEASEQVLALVRRVEPEVVLFDFGAAREPGSSAQSLEVLRQILNLAPDTKIIAMTEQDSRDLAVQAVGVGATDFYYKPIDAGVLSFI